mmetsp:Transcript_84656/g.239965  ORF Transcript_84656/g.239965 Transcript_84656/m.239965 type:complete len:203 (+) Transcript_84656:131-739(+)
MVCAFGQWATIQSQPFSTIASQSGTIGNFFSIRSHTSLVARSSICFFEATAHTSLSMRRFGIGGKASVVFGHRAAAASQARSTAAWQTLPGMWIFPSIALHIALEALSSTPFFLATLQARSSISFGSGSPAPKAGQRAATASQAAFTSVAQSGSKRMLGSSRSISEHVALVALSSINFSFISLHTSSSISFGSGRVSRVFGQ